MSSTLVRVRNILLGLFLLQQATCTSFGPACDFGGVGKGNFVRDVRSTLVVPEGQNLGTQQALWVGIGAPGGLVQSILNRHKGDGVAK